MKFAGLWGLATMTALTLSWVAVSQVRDRVIQPVAVVPTTLVASGVETPPPTVIPVEPTVDQPEPSITATTVSASSSVGSSTTSTTRALSSSTTTTSTTVPQPTTTTTTTTTSSNFTPSSHSTPGGTVTIETGAGQVRFVSAIPQAGFTTDLRETGPERVRVRFVGTTTTFEFEAEWEDGGLEISTEEDSP